MPPIPSKCSTSFIQHPLHRLISNVKHTLFLTQSSQPRRMAASHARALCKSPLFASSTTAYPFARTDVLCSHYLTLPSGWNGICSKAVPCHTCRLHLIYTRLTEKNKKGASSCQPTQHCLLLIYAISLGETPAIVLKSVYCSTYLSSTNNSLFQYTYLQISPPFYLRHSLLCKTFFPVQLNPPSTVLSMLWNPHR